MGPSDDTKDALARLEQIMREIRDPMTSVGMAVTLLSGPLSESLQGGLEAPVGPVRETFRILTDSTAQLHDLVVELCAVARRAQEAARAVRASGIRPLADSE
ncbi:MAG: hypothetical protein V3V08_18105 [Nannocystaceae bacterium]